MGTETKQSIEEIAKNLLTFKVTGKCEGEFPHPANQPREFAELVEYLEKQGYVVKKEENSKPVYYVTINGLAYFNSKNNLDS